MKMHEEPHPLAGKNVLLNDKVQGDPEVMWPGRVYTVEDWWDRVSGGSWMYAEGNPACLKYAMRSAMSGLPLDNEVVYGKIDGLGHLIHASELGEEYVPEPLHPESTDPLVDWDADTEPRDDEPDGAGGVFHVVQLTKDDQQSIE